MRLALFLLAAAASAPVGPPGGEDLFRGPARCLLSYLEAVRLAGPRGPVIARQRRPSEQDYRQARALTAPRALAEAEREAANGVDHPLAPWRTAARGRVLESFSLLAVRRAPRGTAVVTVRERWRRDGLAWLEVTSSEYLLARVDGEWKVIDRRAGGRFQDRDIAEGYPRWFDDPLPSRP
ncbi:MAG TPA: hypothetical protein VFG59_17645 [Anaeromyxobacter sp.]|nr:hypothetical protein [Anaeromyxobacter sp.]